MTTAASAASRQADDSKERQPAGEPVIQALGVTRAFGEHVAVRDLTFDVGEGTILRLIGPSGSGKTTTVRMLTGTLGRTSGEMRVLAQDPLRFTRGARAEIAYMPQLFSLYDDLTAQENVGFVAALYGIGPFRGGQRIRHALEIVELWEERGRLARNLSGGMQRRLELACALVHSPSVLFIDEPTSGIDPILRETIWTELRRLRDDGKTLLVTTQYVSEAEYCDQVALIADGELVAHGSPDELRHAAFGGDILEVRATVPVRAEMLSGVAGIIEVSQVNAQTLRVVAEDAGRATPDIVSALTDLGIDIAGLEERQTRFDEVFTMLVEQRRAARTEHAGQDDGPTNEQAG